MTAGVVDTATTYLFIKKLVTPFSKWPAFKTGVIDAEGNQVVSRDKFTSEQTASFGYFDVLVMNLKLLLAKVPGGSSKLGTMAAGLLLLHEHPKVVKEDEELLHDLPSLMEGYLDQAATLIEDLGGSAAPTNVVGGGAVAGTGVGIHGEPPGPKKRNSMKNRAVLSSVNTILKRK